MNRKFPVQDFSTVTEVPGNRVTSDQLQRMFHRYRFAADFCKEKDVLEVACGSGPGLGYLARRARRVVGGDCTAQLVFLGREHYRDRLQIFQLDAQQLPFSNNSFDVLVLYEAIYYLSHPRQFLTECKRILRDRGVLLICTVNKDWSDFNPSPYSTTYFSISELHDLLHKHFPQVNFFGAFLAAPDSALDGIKSLVKRVAVALNLMPKTMKGKEVLKRIFFGKLFELPMELEEGMFAYTPPDPIAFVSSNFQHKVLYAVARI